MKHYDISYAGKEEDYKGKGFGERNLPARDDRHVDEILSQYREAIAQDEEAMKRAGIEETRGGYYLKFQNAADYDFALTSLDCKSIGHIVSVSEQENAEGKLVTSAVLYLKKEKKNWLNKKASEYKTQTTKKGNKRNMALIDTIDHVSAVTVESLWRGKGNMPEVEREWVELWFEEDDADVVLQHLVHLGIEHKERSLKFPERVVVLAYVNRRDLEHIFYASSTFVRISSVPTLAGFIADECEVGQKDWMDIILQQFRYDRIHDKYLCLLDSGVVKDHPMLLPVLANEDRFVVNPNWGVNDVKRHGTLMAGLATYGDLTEIVHNARGVEPGYRLCSVKVLPNDGQTLKEFWADYTKQAVSLAEIGHGQMPEIMAYCMAVAEVNGYSDGTPSSWSGALDQICCGEDGLRRLFIQCAGNIDDDRDFMMYPHSNALRGVVNPGQAWNALTVGAYTEKCNAFDEQDQQLVVVAQKDSLSPYTTTSMSWGKQSPIKPEVVMEGGNRTRDLQGTNRHRDLELLTTGTQAFFDRPFALINATSAATALAARYASMVSVDNPNYWPETVRGLFVHTAQWTDQMMQEYPDVDERLRMCGYGVPNLDKMLESRKNGVTFIAQRTIQPYKKGEKSNSFNKMHIYTLPWPKDALIGLGEKNVRLTITLSYYVEPGPTDNFASSFKKYNYASAGLRFELSTFRDTEKSFKARILREYDEDEMRIPNDTPRWGLGILKRTKGSIHKDWIECMAADLAQCNMIAVFPVSGWWYKRKGLNKIEETMHYSLIVSLECDEEQVDFSTEIESRIPIEQQVLIETGLAK